MPAMIAHYLLARRTEETFDLPFAWDREAFLLGAQGPDILFFFRAYPWLIGKSGLPVGNALHEVRPSRLFDTLRRIADEAPEPDKAIINGYIAGFLCHYAVDRTLHPFVCYRQQELQALLPHLAKDSSPYHYRYESALDTLLLRRERDRSVTDFKLKTVIPAPDVRRDAVIAALYHRLLLDALGKTICERSLRRLTADMRHSMRLMTDRTGIKRRLIYVAERICRRDARLSSLLRRRYVDEYDYANRKHTPWIGEDGVSCATDVYQLCDDAVCTARWLIVGFFDRQSGMELTDDIDFAGCRYHKEETDP